MVSKRVADEPLRRIVSGFRGGSIDIIRSAGAEPAGLAIALDRQERGTDRRSAAQELQAEFGIPCLAIAGLDDLIDYLAGQPGKQVDLEAIKEYRVRYGIDD